MAKLTINDERKNVQISIQEVNAGEIFNYEGKYFIMTDDEYFFMAVNLKNGERQTFHYSDKVILINADLTIK